MFNWRKLPHLGYGKCGGANRDCSLSKPRDWMDLAFEQHDKDLEIAEKEKYPAMRKLAKRAADKKLAKALRKGDPKKLKLWGKIYLWGAKFVFQA